MKIDELPGCPRGGKSIAQPSALNGVGRDAVRLDLAVNGKDLDGSLAIIVIAFVAWQREVICVARHPIMVSHAGKEAVTGRSLAVSPLIRIDKLVIELTNVFIVGGTVRVVADRDDEIGVPTLDEAGHICGVRTAVPVVANHTDHDLFRVQCDREREPKRCNE